MRIPMPHRRTNIHKYIPVNLLICKYQLFSCMFEYSGKFNLFIL